MSDENLVLELSKLEINRVKLLNGFNQKRFLGSVLTYKELKAIADFIIERESKLKEQANK